MPLPNSSELITHLQSNPFFAGLDEIYLQTLAQHAIWREYTAGEVIMLEGDTQAGLFYLQHGWVKVSKVSQGGREQVLRFVEPGETFNEIGVLASLPNPATAIALEPAGVWFIHKTAVQHLLHEYPDMAEHIIAKLATRLIYLVSLVADLSLRPVTGRLASLLLTEAVDDVLHRPRWYTQAELAARLGTVPDVVQRALRQLESDGLIRVQRHAIYILDRDALIAIAEQ